MTAEMVPRRRPERPGHKRKAHTLIRYGPYESSRAKLLLRDRACVLEHKSVGTASLIHECILLDPVGGGLLCNSTRELAAPCCRISDL